MSIEVLVAYHADAPLVSGSIIQPIQVGRALTDKPHLSMIGDDTGDNISELNRKYCELSAVYWAWKNSRADKYVGLMHYRRFLDFQGIVDSKRTEVFVSEFDVDEYLFNSEKVISSSNADLIIPKPHLMTETIWENYCRGHHKDDLDATREIIRTGDPRIFSSFEETMQSKEIYLGNIFLMNRELFDEYCHWLFNILNELEKVNINRKYYSLYQSRYLGFIAERLFTVYVNYICKTMPDLKVERKNILNTSNAIVFPYRLSKNMNSSNSVNVVFSADRNYVPHTAAMLHSLLQKKSSEAEYNLFFLATEVGEQEKELLTQVVGKFKQTSLHVINVGAFFDSSYRSPTRAPSNATYNRFFIFDLFPHLNRVLYLDCDMIVMDCIEDLFRTDMENNALAGVPDHIMTRSLNTPVKTKDPNFPDMYQYQKEVLKLSDSQIYKYLNAGMLLFNLKCIDTKKCSRELKQYSLSEKFLFRDQDILNSYFRGLIKILPNKYNVLNTFKSGYSKVPKERLEEAMIAKTEPAIIHFASGEFKPWNKKSVPYADQYWKHLICTPFYAEVIGELTKAEIREANKWKIWLRIYSFFEFIYDRLPLSRPILSRIDFILRRISKRG